MTTISQAVKDAVQAWMEQDPEPQYRDELKSLLEEESAELETMFQGRISFGTAGLRAEMGPGPNSMNRLVVRQTTAGLMKWLLPKATGDAEGSPRVVIGYDARHHSHEFAWDVARVVAGLGGRAELLPEPLPTPVLAFAVLSRRADAGVMITASHNPAKDNGYKLYLSDGIQLVSPADTEVAKSIEAELAWPPTLAESNDAAITVLGNDVAEAHLSAAAGVLKGHRRDVTMVYTAMHGVGGLHMTRAMELGGFPSMTNVTEQFEPDPLFPTAAFPNPEEEGALDLAIALAEEIAADMIIANDPDADRLAIAVPRRPVSEENLGSIADVDADDVADAGFVRLSGDQVGVLLADYLIGQGEGPDRIVSNSLVSSRLMARMAASAGIESATTLTGFKWVARPIVDRPELEFVLGYEEALGYCVGGAVRDKDGISAALVAAEMVAVLKASGRTVWDRLDDISRQHGVFLTGPVTIRLPDVGGQALLADLMERITSTPPLNLAGAQLTDLLDLSVGETLPPAVGIVLSYSDDTRVIARPSGTEPKLKIYIEVVEPVELLSPVAGSSSDSTSSQGLRRSQGLRHSQANAKRRLALVQEELVAYLS